MSIFYHGKKSYVVLNYAAGPVGTNISTELNKFDFPHTSKTAEVSTFGTEDEAFVAGLRGSDITGDGFFDSATEDLFEAIMATSDRSFQLLYAPTGLPTGVGGDTARKAYLFTALLTDLNVGGDTTSAVKSTFKAKVTGKVLIGTVSTTGTYTNIFY